jgi:hypothetical protein
MTTRGLHLDRRQHGSMVWWDIVHTPSGLPVPTATSQFDRKRDAQAVMDRLLGTGLDWTLPSRKAMAASNAAGAAQVDRIVYEVAGERGRR